MRLERAQYEADLAHRRFLAVEPENRLVARNLERAWNEKLAEVDRLKDENLNSSIKSSKIPGHTEIQSVLNLSKDFPKVWRAETTTQIERKQLIRCLIQDVTFKRIDRTVFMGVRWQTDICTTLKVILPTSGDHIRTEHSTLTLISELASHLSNRQIADYLNDKGIKPRVSDRFTDKSVSALRFKNRIVLKSRK